MGTPRESVEEGKKWQKTLSIKGYVEDKEPEKVCEGGVGVSKSPITVAPGKTGR